MDMRACDVGLGCCGFVGGTLWAPMLCIYVIGKLHGRLSGIFNYNVSILKKNGSSFALKLFLHQ